MILRSAVAFCVTEILLRSSAIGADVPQGAHITAGRADIRTPSPKTMVIRQRTEKAIINWDEFNIGALSSVRFDQPGKNAAVLNRVTGSQMSRIEGMLRASGKVYLINPRGVLIGPKGRIDTNTFVASTLDVDNAAFLSGSTLMYMDADGTAGDVVNRGVIHTSNGDIVLLGKLVRNSGQLSSAEGNISLASGSVIEMYRQGDDQRLSVRVKQGTGVIDNAGSIQAAAVEMQASGGNPYALAINNDGIIRATTVSHDGGRILLKASTGTIQQNGTLDAHGEGKRTVGGDVTIVGDNILLTDKTNIDVSGGAKGGKVRIGTESDWNKILPLDAKHNDITIHNIPGDADPGSQQADAVVMAPGAVINADALRNGDGGRVTVWSEKFTNFAGKISANASGEGSGGWVETSSRQILQSTGNVYAIAPSRRRGLWLLDPYNVTISNSTTNGSFNSGSPNVFTPSANTATVNNSTINTSLNAGTDVTITTTGAGSQNGDITISSSISKTSGGDATLWLAAANDILTSSSPTISSTNNKLHIVMQSDSDGSGTGRIKLSGTTTLTTNGGDLTMSGGNYTLANLQSTGFAMNTVGGTGGIELGASTTITTTTGNIYIRGKGIGSSANYYDGIDLLGGSITTTTGNINITAVGGSGSSSNNDGIYMTGGTIASSGGAITINATGSTTAASSNGFRGLYTTGTIQNSSTGTITINATGGTAAGGSANYGLQVAGGKIQSNGSGAINLNINPGNGSTALYSSGSSPKIGIGSLGGSYTGTLTFTTDSINFSVSTTIAGSGALVIQPATASTTIGLGASATGTLNLDATELGYFSDGYSSITVGSSSGSGDIDIRTVAFKDTVLIQSPASDGDITINGALSTGSTTQVGLITLRAGDLINVASGASIASQGQAITLNADRDASGAGGIYVAGTITSNNADITLGGGSNPSSTAAYTTDSTNPDAINISSTISSGSGAVSILGTASATGTAPDGIYISGTVQSTTGNISLTGIGSNITTSHGIELTGSITTTSGALSLTGSGVTGTNTNRHGISVTGGTISSTSGSTITLTGTGGTSSGSDNDGIYSSGYIKNAGTGTTTITGTVGAGSNSESLTLYPGEISSTGSGAISITASVLYAGNSTNRIGQGTTGTFTGDITINADQIALAGTSTIQSTGNLIVQPITASTTIGLGASATGTLNLDVTELSYLSDGFASITIGGTAASAGNMDVRTVAFNDPVTLRTTARIDLNGALSTGSGTSIGSIWLRAGNAVNLQTGGSVTTQGEDVALNGDWDGSGNGGVILASGTSVTTNGGDIIVGGGSNPLTTVTYGTSGLADSALQMNNATLASGAGDITINALGRAGSAGSRGVYLYGGAQISSTSGNITISATGGAATTTNQGVYLTGSNTKITTATGAINITGVGAGTGSTNPGIQLDSSGAITATSTGSITLTGTGAATTAATTDHYGVYVNSGSISVVNGDLTINATGGGPSGSNQYGFNIAGGSVTSTGSGNIAITGTNTNGSAGVYVSGGSITSSSTGNITIAGSSSTGASGNGISLTGGSVYTTSGTLSLTGTSAAATPIITTGSPAIGNASQSGSLTLSGNNITLSSTTTISGTGALTLQPITTSTTMAIGTSASGTFTLDGTELDTIQNGFANIYIGRTDSIGVMDIRAYTFKDAITLRTPEAGGSITVNGALATGSGTSSGQITLQSGDNISVASGNSITSQGSAIVLNSDREANNAGYINVSGGITSNGGDIILSGGSGANNAALIASGAAHSAVAGTPAISITNGITVASGAGNIYINGTGITGGASAIQGVNIDTSSAITSTTGAINIIGIAPTGGSAGTQYGVYVNAGSITSTSGNISVTGTASTGATGSDQGGLRFTGSGSKIQTGGTGTITVIGTGGAAGSGSNNTGIRLGSGTAIQSNGSGDITITTYAGNGSPAFYTSTATNYIGLGQLSGAYTGNITINADSMLLTGANIAGTGTLTIQPTTATTTIGLGASATGTLNLDATELGYIQNGFSSITIGKNNAGAIDSRAVTYNDNLTLLTAGNITLNGALSVGANNLTLNSGGTVTQSAAITASGLGLLGGGAFTLANTSNAVSTLAGATAAMSYYNNGALTIGTVGSTNGITATGAVTIQNASTYDITLSQAISSSAASNAVVIASGDDFINSGSAAITTGSGRFLIYSQTPADNTNGGLTGTKRYNKTYAGYAPASVVESGNVFLYSVAPTLTITADSLSKTYGAADPSLTYTASGLIDSDTFGTATTGSPSITRAAGSNAGTYTITAAAGTLASTMGYTLAYANGTFTINPAALAVTAAAKSKTYGAADPTLTYTYSGLVNGDTASVFSGSLARAAGENVGTYAINQGTVTAGSNYTISYTSDNLTIGAAALNVTAAAKSKTYGGADPALTYTYSGLVNGDTAAVFSGSLARAAGENVGTYAINQGTVTAGSNYTISYTSDNLIIGAATLTVTAAAKTKTYGGADPALTYTYSGLVNSDTASVFSGSLARTAGENVGTYAINQGTVTAGSNYTISYVSDNLTISPATLNVTAAAKSKTYGASDPALTYTYSGLVNSDTASVFSGSLARAAGENVGTYAINQGTVTAGSNYTISYAGANLTIGAAALTVTADAKSKTYGGADPSLTYTYSGLANGDTAAVFSGSLARAAGENVGSYAINQGTVTAGSNYTISFVSDNLTINPATLTVTAAAKSKTYGGSDPSLTYTYSGLTNGDTAAVFSGSLTRTAGENVGAYAINQGSVTAGSNYTISYVGNNLTINAATLTVTADAKSKTYGAVDPSLTYTYSGLVGGDTAGVFSGSLARAAGENVGTYAINQGTLTAGSNYSISYVSDNLTINPASLTVTAAAKSKTYGGSDPALTYTYSGLTNGDTAAVFSGSLTRAAGENVGTYAINQGTVTAGSNYTISYNAANLTIGAASLTVTADAKSKTYGGADPSLTYTYSGLTNGDTAAVFSGSLTRTAGENVGTYAINQGTVAAGSNYTINYVSDNLTINPATLTVTAAAKSKTYGSVDPALTYSYSGLVNSDTAAVFSGSLARAVGENVGAYAINQGTVTAGSNYTISYVSDNLTINPATLTVTADAKSKTYGAADPSLTYTYSGLTNSDTASVFSGSLTCTGGENVGTYAINQGSLSAGSNYTISYVSDNLTINAAALNVTAVAKNKTYGDVDPALTYTYSGLVGGDTASVFSGSLARAAGENVGTYAINQGTVTAGSNYTINYTSANFTIGAATLTVTADAKSKTYGGSDPALTYTYSGLTNGDTSAVFSGSLARAVGENVGTYAINQGTVTAGSNYTISYIGDNLTINQATLTVTAGAKSKTYGNADPALTYTYSGLTNGDTAAVFSGSLARAAGENVGIYAINQGTVTAGSNYAISYIGDNLTINTASLTVTADAKSKTYGAADPTLTYTYSGLTNGDTASVFSGSLARAAGENVGAYAINQGSVTAGSNYSITYVGDNLTINPASLTVTAAAKSKIYGASDPALTYTYSGLTNSDTASVFSGSLARAVGENVGAYAINQGTVDAGSNYTITYVGSNLTINAASLTVTADAQSKTYGAVDPTLTYTYSGLTNGDTAAVFSGSLARAAGENVGTYAINQSSLTAGSNYSITYVGDSLTITPASLTVTAAAKSKTYGTADPALTYTYSGLVNSDTASVFSGSLARAAGENVGTYAINQGTVTAGSNYTISYVGDNLTIGAATLTVNADAKSKTYGTADPALTYTYSGLANGDTAAVFTGAIARAAGENVGTYAINQGTLGAGSNYTISYTGANLSITAAALNVTADSKTKIYGDADPALTYTYSGLTNGDTAAVFSGSLARAAGENVGTYAINQGTVSAGGNYTINYVSDDLTINPATLAVTADAKSKIYGGADPALTYSYSGLKNSDTAAVFSGSLARATGENVGTYAINQGTVSAGSNYTISYTSDNLSITPATLTVNAAAKSKPYGTADPALTYTYSGLTNSDTASVFSGSLARAAGENVGTYAINQGSVTAGSNYTINYVGNNLSITAATLVVTADIQSKVYGSVDPSLTYTYSGLANGDTASVFTGALARAAGENVGTYAINQGTLDAGSNYSISYTGDNLSITPATLTVTAAAKSKTYGTADPALTYTYSGLTNGDTASVFSGSLARATGENVGTYAINQGSVDAGSNYSITYIGNNLTISAATLTVTADAQSKTYGGADPSLTYTYSGLANGDTSAVFAGTLARAVGENVGTYAINQGSLTAGSNYSISYASDNLTINPASLTVTAAAKSKTYGNADPALTYSYSGLTNGDTASVFTGSLTRVAGENVGTYAINQGTVAAGSNYTITYVGDNLTINTASLTITADAQSKTYGAVDPSLTYTYAGLANGDTAAVFAGSLVRAAGENVGIYAINQGSLTASSNYSITYVGDNLTINPATLTVTADSKSKTYGSADPALTYTYAGLTNSDTAAVFSGSLARVAGENVGTYAINQGTVTAGSNYTISYVSDNLTINAASLTVTADAKSKTYGSADPSLTYTYSGLTNGDTAAVFTGSLARATGENVGAYAINQGTVTAGSNYTITYISDDLTINPASLTVTAGAKSKIYGNADPALTYTYAGLANGDTASVFSGSLARVAGENVGVYAINQGTVTAGSNYTITYVSDNLSITPATLVVNADAQSKVYGDIDPALTYTYSGLKNSDTNSVFTGSLARAVGENVGSYTINQNTLDAGSNYTISYTSDDLTITAATLVVNADVQSKIYGDIDPALTYTYSGLKNGDTNSVFTGSLARVTGENVGSYSINQNTLDAGTNYTISYTGNNLTITPATLSVDADAQSKIYGDADPALTYIYSGLKNGDTNSVFTGSLARTSGENVGSYAINQNTLDAGSNYTISYTGSNLTITPATLNVTADAQSKIYGDADPAFSYTYSGLKNGDTLSVFTGGLARAAGENVGIYAINQGSLDAGGNYTISYFGDNLTITAATLSVTADAQSKIYGDADPALSYVYSGLKNGDTNSVFTGSLARIAGENTGTYAINQNTLDAGSNYTISYTGNNLTITPATLTVTADSQTKIFGDIDPALTYAYSGLKNSDTNSVFTGSLARVTGENVGSYAINQNTLDAGGNYTISYVGNNLSITPATLNVTADAQSKIYGDADPALSYTYSGLKNGDTNSIFTGGLARAVGENVGVYAISQGSLDAGANYSISYTGSNLTITQAALLVTADPQNKIYGDADPALSYTYSGLKNGDTNSVFTGSLTRIAGENVGNYAINQGSLDAGGNYSLIYTGDNLNITQATLDVIADPQTKIYGDLDPALTYTYSGLKNGDTSAIFTGDLSRKNDENVGTYPINQGSLDAGGNYAINYVGASFTITPATLNVIADPQTKVYGDADPALSYTYSGLTNSDDNSVFTGSLSRIAGENVGNYAINQGSLDAGTNYTINYTADNLAITQATLTVNADAQTKIYGDLDPALTYTYAGLKNGDSNSVFTGSLSRIVGENVGSYSINQGSLGAGANYTIAYNSDNLTITAATLTVNADAQTKVYGDIDPTLSYTYSGLKNGDSNSVFTGSLSRIAGENVGSYVINQGTLDAGGNYTISYTGNSLAITPATLTVNADAQTKTYGNADPALSYAYSGLKNGDTNTVFTGGLARIAGENVGAYAINQGSLDAGANYNISYTGNNLTITTATLTVTADSQTKIYGDLDPALTYTYSGLTNGDTATVFTGSLARVAGENVGAYAINQGSVDAGANYTISYVGSNLSITPATLTVNADAQTKIYGDLDPALTYLYSGLKNGDTNSVFTGSLSRITGENVGSYAINQNTLDAGGNYTISYTGNNLSITPATLIVNADAQSKIYGDADPALSYVYSGLKNGDTNSVFAGSLSRVAGENVGAHAINQGSLDAGSNYTISYTGNNLTITPATLTVSADAKTKIYGDIDPTLSYAYSGLKNGDTNTVFTGGLARIAGENVGAYAINQGSLDAGGNYTISYTGNNLTITTATLTVNADPQTKIYGDIDPALTYAYSGLKNGDTSSVFTGSLARVAGENVGSYAINQNTLDAGGNYTISYSGNNLSITPATLTVTADAKTKLYGGTDPSLTYTYSGLKNGDTGSALAGSLVRNSGEDVGAYAINQGTVNAGANYTISYAGANLDITARQLFVAADPKAKTYGDADPALTYSVSGLQFGQTAQDVLTGSLTRDAGENKGIYAITQGTLSPNANYSISYVGDNLNIASAILTIVAYPQTKLYGDNDPALTYSATGFQNGDDGSIITGLPVRTGNENVGPHPILSGTLDAGANYTISFTSDYLTINPATLTVTANPQTKVYGDTDPALSYIYSGLKNGDTSTIFAGSLIRNTGENVGAYAINQGTFTAGNNYTIQYSSDNLTITPATLTVNADAKTKIYGDTDPSLTYTYSGLKNSDTNAVFTGSLARITGENVGNYAINQNTLDAGGNYTIAYTDNNLAITQAVLTVNADAQTRIYGDIDPALTYTYSGLKNGDTNSIFTGSLARIAGENVGSYAINQDTLDAGGNYTISYTGNDLTITPAILAVTADAQGKTYGDADPALTYVYSGLKNGDTNAIFTGSLARIAGENVGTYAINQGSFDAGANYTISYTGDNLSITPATLNVSAEAQTKIYGNIDPALTYTYSGLKNGDTDSILSGSQARIAGENVGNYTINQGTLDAGANYTINYTGSSLAITPATLNVIADGKSKVYGDTDPALTYTYSGLKNGDTDSVFTGSQQRIGGENVGNYVISQGTLDAGGNYTIAYTGSSLTITPATLNVIADGKSKVYGDTDPALTYTYSGLKNGDTGTIVIGQLIRDTGENVGGYVINQGSIDAGANYAIQYTSGLLSITPANLTIAARDASREQGKENPEFRYDLIGLKFNDDADDLSRIILSTDATVASQAGKYLILTSGGISPNYIVNYTYGELTITKTLNSNSTDLPPLPKILMPLTGQSVYQIMMPQHDAIQLGSFDSISLIESTPMDPIETVDDETGNTPIIVIPAQRLARMRYRSNPTSQPSSPMAPSIDTANIRE